MLVPKLEKSIGMEVYATRCLGIGGAIRRNIEDFVVQEVLVDGSIAGVSGSNAVTEPTALNCSSIKNRYLLCVLVKRNWDMFMALRSIVRQLRMSQRQVQIAGIKDAKALTAQHITIEGASMEDLQNLHLKDIEVRPVGYVRTELSSYYLLKNNFRLRIRSIRHSKTVIETRVTRIFEELGTLGGIPNFFGHQRFGTARPITHLVGRALVKGNIKKAVMLFLAKPSAYEHPKSRHAREELEATQDFKQALKSYPKQLRYERLMLKSLSEKPDDFGRAFRKLPLKLRELFIQAYQSFLFNRFLSNRINKGLTLNNAETGDYVINVERSGLPMPIVYKTATFEDRAKTNEAVKNGKMRIAIPLIGFKQRLSQGVEGEIERRILEEEEVSREDFKIAAMPEMNSKGKLRPVITPVKDFSFDDMKDEAGIHLSHALDVNFALYRGSYATVVLRELMKPRKPVEAGF